MKFNDVFTGWVWSFICGGVTILGFFGVSYSSMTNLFSALTTKEIIQYTLLILACFFFILGIALKRKDKAISTELYVLQNIAKSKKDRDCAKWDYAEYGYSAIPVTETWNQWIDGMIRDMGEQKFKNYNFGDYFYFFDFDSGKEIRIPTDESNRHEVMGKCFTKGMVLRLMPKNP